MRFQILQSEKELDTGYAILKELRVELTREKFLEIYREAHRRDDYTLVGGFDRDALVGVMGYRILYDYVHGKHLYIDDLVVSEAARSKGFGAGFLKHAEILCHEFGGSLLRLSTGTGNERGKSFYEREGWALRSVTYKKQS